MWYFPLFFGLILFSPLTGFETRLNSSYAKYSIGRWTYGSPKVYDWGDASTLVIGKFCSIADGTTILIGGEHDPKRVTTYPFFVLWSQGKGYPYPKGTKGDVIIGNDVWIGYGVTILSGVKIGDGAVIGAKSLVTKDIAAYSIVGGSPAKFIRSRFPADVIEKLLKIGWWDWPDQEIAEALPLLLSENIELFIQTYSRRQP